MGVEMRIENCSITNPTVPTYRYLSNYGIEFKETSKNLYYSFS